MEDPNIGKPLTEAQRERLTVLMEECAEVTKVCAKTLRFGYYARDGNTGCVYDNRTDLEKEIGNVDAAIDLILRAGDVSGANIRSFCNEKTKEHAAKKYLLHQL